MNKLYLIKNVGCDDETSGLVRISDDALSYVIKAIEDLNKNSNCSCMPTIVLIRIDDSFIRPTTEEDPDYERLYMDDGIYVLVKKYSDYHFDNGFTYINGAEQIV